ncbi:hypothetical protein ABPG74_021663 [Tetrahymena malaccensis]
MKIIQDGIDYFLFLLTTTQIGMAFIKYTITQNYQYPYLGLIIISAPLAIIGFFTILKFVKDYNGRGSIFYLDINQYIILSLLYGFSQILSVTALKYSHLTLIRYIIIGGITECLVLPLLSKFILNRMLYSHYILTVLLSIASLCVNELLVLSRSSLSSGISVSTESGWEGPLITFFSKFLFLLGSVLSKRFILKRGHYYKLKDKSLYNQNIPIGALNYVKGGDITNYYKDYVSGDDDKPKLLKKDSILYKRFQLIKKLDPNYEDLRFETGERDPYLESKIVNFRKLVGNNTVKVNQLVELPKYFTRPKFQYYLGYGALNAEELDTVLNLDENLMNKYIKRREETNFKDLKKWEVENMLKQEENERQYLEEFLKDYLEMKFNAHYFHDKDDMLLTKIDSIFDSMIYDNENFNIDIQKTVELYSIYNLFLLILSFFASYFNLEFYYAIYQNYELSMTQVKPYFVDQDNLYIMFIVAALFQLVKPFFFNRILQNHTQGVYFFIKLLTEFLIIIFASTFTNQTPSIATNTLISIFLLFFANYANYSGVNHKKNWTEFASLIELVKSYFSQDLEVDQLLLLEIRLIQIHQLLGRDDFLRILIDLIVSKNPRQLLHTNNPVMFLRENFDLFYNRRAQNWGGGFPRPTVEGIESSWISQSHKDVWINSINQMKNNYEQEKKEYEILKEKLLNKANSQSKNESYKED